MSSDINLPNVAVNNSSGVFVPGQVTDRRYYYSSQLRIHCCLVRSRRPWLDNERQAAEAESVEKVYFNEQSPVTDDVLLHTAMVVMVNRFV